MSQRESQTTLLAYAPEVSRALMSEAHDAGERGDSEPKLVVFRKSRRAHSAGDDETWVEEDVANTVNPHDQGEARATQLVAHTILSRKDGAGRGHDDDANLVAEGWAVRRLTVTEQERLQGLPDGWTHLCDREPYSTETCVCPDSPRQAAIGNAVAVPVAEYIGRRIVEVHGGG